MLMEETSVPLGALPIEAFKTHLRLGTGFSEQSLQDPVLEGFLRAAMAAIEARTGKILLSRSFSWNVTRWRDPDCAVLPIAPVRSVTEVAVINLDGSETVANGSAFVLERDMQQPLVRSKNKALPAIPTGGSAEVRFVAGYGSVWGELPADLAQAVMLLAAHYYEYREEVSLSQGCMPFGVISLIERYKPMRLMAGARL